MREGLGWRFWVAALLIVFGFAHFIRHRPVRQPPGVLVAEDPQQVTLESAPALDIEQGRYHLQPLADFHITGRVLSREDYHWDRLANLVPTDLAMGWGRMSDSAVLKDIEVSQGERFYYWYTHTFPIPRQEIETHSANMHLIPADPIVRREIGRVRQGQVVHFDGKLVELRAEDGWSLKSSLTREDTGPGACELVWVERLELR